MNTFSEMNLHFFLIRRDVSLNTGVSSTKLDACNIFLQCVKDIEELTSARVFFFL